jgi:MinD superfamily P-loop ATPase
MRSLRVAIVSRDPEARLAAARAFDKAPAEWIVSLHHEIPLEADVIALGPDVEGEGLRFDAGACEDLVDKVTEAATTSGRVIVVSGVGRGVGCTTVGLHLAAEFGSHHDTCFLDLDTAFGAADHLGLEGEHLTWRDVDASPESVRQAALPVVGGFRALLAPHGAEIPEDLISGATSQFERIVVDCPADGPIEAVLEIADVAVVVVPASGLGARRLDRVVSRFEALPYALVANRIGSGSETTRSGLGRVAGRKFAIDLPCCGRVREAEDRGLLFASPLSRWKWAIARLARILEQA